MPGKLEYAKLLKQVVWNKPSFSPEGFLITELNMDKNDKSSFYYKTEEEGEIDCIWMTGKDNALLAKVENPTFIISPAVLEKDEKTTKWVLNKEETERAKEQLKEKKLLAIQTNSHPLMHKLTSFLQENKMFISGTICVLRSWDEDEEKRTFNMLKKLTLPDISDVEIKTPIGNIRKVELDWDKLQYTVPQTETQKKTQTYRRPTLSPQEKLSLITELINSAEMDKLASVLSKHHYVLDYSARFHLACELVNGQTMAVLREE